MKDLDLTKMNDDRCCAPASPGATGPTVHLDSKKPIDLPKEGTATLKFKIRRVTNDLEDGRWEVNLELLKLSDIKSGKKALPPPKEVETGDALDALMAEMGESKE